MRDERRQRIEQAEREADAELRRLLDPLEAEDLATGLSLDYFRDPNPPTPAQRRRNRAIVLTSMLLMGATLTWGGWLRRGNEPGQAESEAAAEEEDDSVMELTLFASRLGAADSTFAVGFPLRQGHIADSAALGSVCLTYDDVEVKSRITPLRGRYYGQDSSLISLRIQRKHHEAIAANDTIVGYALRFEQACDSTLAAAITAETKFAPDAYLRPDPTYYMGLNIGVVGPLVPIDSVRVAGSSRQDSIEFALDSLFGFYMNYNWVTNGDSVQGTEFGLTAPGVATFEHLNSFYDPCLNSIRYFARGGEMKYIERGLKMCKVYTNYQDSINWEGDVFRQFGWGPAAAYWWTGDNSYRLAQILIGIEWSSGVQGNVPASFTDGRSQARRLSAAMSGWLLDDIAAGGGSALYADGARVARLQMDTVVKVEIVDRQLATADSTDGMIPDTVGLGLDSIAQSNFMSAGILTYYAAIYQDYRGGACARCGGSAGYASSIDSLIPNQGRFMETQIWDSIPAFYYHSWETSYGEPGSCVGYPGGRCHPGQPNERVPLAMMESYPWFAALGQDGNDEFWLPLIDSIFTKYSAECCGDAGDEVILDDNADYTQKHLHEGFYNYMHAMARRRGLP